MRSFAPAPFPVDRRERLRVVAGAFAGILLTASVGRLLAGTPLASAWLMAPLGASAVLVFAAPASPLAQPWAVVGGNVSSALIGLTCAIWVPDVALAAALAVATAIAAMFAMRCLHPPGGATALLAVLTHQSAAPFSPATVLTSSLLLVGAGLVYNSLTGRRYPHAQRVPAPTQSDVRALFDAADLDAVLTRYNQILDVSRDDLEALLLAAELEGYRRHLGDIHCAEVMSRDLVWVGRDSTLEEAWARMKSHRIKALPVIDRERRIVGILTMADFLRAAQIDGRPDFRAKLRTLLKPGGPARPDKAAFVGQIMSRDVRVANVQQHVMELLPIFTQSGHHHLPIVDADQRVVGIITQSDFVRFLYQGNYLTGTR